MNDHILIFCGDSTFTQVGTFVLQPMCTTCYPHVPSDEFQTTVFIANKISLHCWGSPSFIKKIHVPLATLEQVSETPL